MCGGGPEGTCGPGGAAGRGEGGTAALRRTSISAARAKFAKCDNCDVARLLPREAEAIGINKRG